MEKGKRLLASRLEREEETLEVIRNRVKAFIYLLVRRGGLPPVLATQPTSASTTTAGGGAATTGRGGSPASQPSTSISSNASRDGRSTSSSSASISPDRGLQRSRRSNAASRLDPGSPTRVDTRRPSRPKDQLQHPLQLSLQAEAVTWSSSPAKSLKSLKSPTGSSRAEKKMPATEAGSAAVSDQNVVRIPTPRTPVALPQDADEAR